MNYLHQEFEAGPEEVVEVSLDNQANVQLLDATNFNLYRTGKPFQYYGGYAEKKIYRLQPPRKERWHLVVDLGGGPGHVKASVRVLPKALAKRL